MEDKNSNSKRKKKKEKRKKKKRWKNKKKEMKRDGNSRGLCNGIRIAITYFDIENNSSTIPNKVSLLLNNHLQYNPYN